MRRDSERDYAETARRLIGMFQANFTKFAPHVDADVLAGQPGCAPRAC